MTGAPGRCRMAAVAALAVVLVACTGGSDGTASPTPSVATPTRTPVPTATPTPTVAPTWPLTGLPASSPADAAKPALTVKVDNTGGARPQVGLSAADLVVEELVEGGLTRLAAMFQSSLPEVVGPVRSVRHSDIGIVLPAGGVVAASGGSGRVLRALDKAGVRVLAEGDAGFSRAGNRRAPYNVMLDLAAAMTRLTAADAPTGPYLPWGPAGSAVPGGRPASGVDVKFLPPIRRRGRGPGRRGVDRATWPRPATSSRRSPWWCWPSPWRTPATATQRATRYRKPCSKVPGKHGC